MLLKLFICADYRRETKIPIKSEVNLSQEISNIESLNLAKVAV